MAMPSAWPSCLVIWLIDDAAPALAAGMAVMIVSVLAGVNVLIARGMRANAKKRLTYDEWEVVVAITNVAQLMNPMPDTIIHLAENRSLIRGACGIQRKLTRQMGPAVARAAASGV